MLLNPVFPKRLYVSNEICNERILLAESSGLTRTMNFNCSSQAKKELVGVLRGLLGNMNNVLPATGLEDMTM